MLNRVFVGHSPVSFESWKGREKETKCETYQRKHEIMAKCQICGQRRCGMGAKLSIHPLTKHAR